MAAPAFRHLPEAQGSPGKTRRRPRAFQRVAVRCGCWLEHDGATVFGNTVDVGRGGLFLRTALPMEPGSQVRVTLTLPDGSGAQLVADGQIVHRIPPSDGDRPGLGVRFLDAAHAQVLGAFLGTSVASDFDDAPDVG